jgi:hypothetical protein
LVGGARHATYAFMTGRHLGIVACTAVLAAGCGARDEGDATARMTDASLPSIAASVEPTLASLAPGSRGAPVYVMLESPSPSCDGGPCTGGFWVRELAGAMPLRFVAHLDFSAAQAAIPQAAGAAAGELLLLGTLAQGDRREGDSSLVVLAAWRGMPDVQAPLLDLYVTVGTAGDHLVAYGLDGVWRHSITAVSLSDLGPPLLDTSWLTGRALGGGAIVAGRLVGTTFDAAQVFVRLPDAIGPCPLLEYSCGVGVATYTLGADRCLFATGCAAAGHLCPEYLPACDPQYQRLSWPSQPHGCPAYACMPGFLAQ